MKDWDGFFVCAWHRESLLDEGCYKEGEEVRPIL